MNARPRVKKLLVNTGPTLLPSIDAMLVNQYPADQSGENADKPITLVEWRVIEQSGETKEPG